MTGLVQKVREAIAHNGDIPGITTPTTDKVARAAIAAVYDDLIDHVFGADCRARIAARRKEVLGDG